jgi:hypothetical protein
MGRLGELERRLANAPDDVRDKAAVLTNQIVRLLEQAEDDELWTQQVGPAYTAGQVAQLLGVSRQAVGQRRGLLGLKQRDGRIVYPIIQFDGAGVLPGIPQVVMELTPVVASPWTIGSWLTSPNPELDHVRPYEALRRGELSAVVQAARQFASSGN